MIKIIEDTIGRINSDLSKAYFQATGIDQGPIWVTSGPDEYPDLTWNIECKWCNFSTKENIHFKKHKTLLSKINIIMLEHSVNHLEYPKNILKVFEMFSKEHYTFMQQSFLYQQAKENYAVSIGLKDNNLAFAKCNICLDEFDIESIDKHLKNHLRIMTFL